MKRPSHSITAAGPHARPSGDGLRGLRIRASRPDDGARVIAIWREAVEATHDFLTDEDLRGIDEEVRGFLPYIALWLAVDANDQAVGFMAMTGTNMDALFIAPDFSGMGVGRLLVEHALRQQPVITTDVNAQNTQAVGFYERLGFVEIGRSSLDDRGRSYPLIHMRLSRSGLVRSRAGHGNQTPGTSG